MESLALIEPLLPAEGNHILIDLATQLWVESTALSSNVFLEYLHRPSAVYAIVPGATTVTCQN